MAPLRYPSWHLNSVTVREGCVILELDMVQQKRQAATGGGKIGDLDLAEWLGIIKPEEIVNGSNNGGKIVFVKVGHSGSGWVERGQ